MQRYLPVGSSEWRSRGYLPHADYPDSLQMISIRLDDAVPEKLIDAWKKELAWVEKLRAGDPRKIKLRRRIEKYEDAGYGAYWLRMDEIAAIVEQALIHFDGERYRLIAWCIMPNHAHVIIEVREGYPLDEVMHSLKSYTAHKANRLLRRKGAFWFREYYDRCIRDAEHFSAAVEYVENNPVKARLARTKEEWKWSSARRRQHQR